VIFQGKSAICSELTFAVCTNVQHLTLLKHTLYFRIIATSVAPYTVLHANAAYGKLLADSQISIQGKHFSSVVSSGTSRLFSLANCATSSTEGRHVTAFAMSQLGVDGIQCEMKVTPIVTSTEPQVTNPGGDVVQDCNALGDDREVRNVTHFCIDLTDVSDGVKTRLNNNDGKEATHSRQPSVSVQQMENLAFSVVG
jgi:hypothetical protein